MTQRFVFPAFELYPQGLGVDGRKRGVMNSGGDGMCNDQGLPGSSLGLDICDLGQSRWMGHWEQRHGGEVQGTFKYWEPVRLG